MREQDPVMRFMSGVMAKSGMGMNDEPGTAYGRFIAVLSSPEKSDELSPLTRYMQTVIQIFREVLAVPKGYRKQPGDHLEIILPASELTPERQTAIVAAIRSHFRIRAEEVHRDMKLTRMDGFCEFRLTLAVCIPSFAGIAICSQYKGNPLAEVIENILIIFCWVMIWQRFQSLVFDRRTQSETAKVYREIADMEITVRAAG